jgi:hypothetical protein
MNVALDANAIAGDLEAVWGADVTAATCTCQACEGITCVDFGGLAALELHV